MTVDPQKDVKTVDEDARVYVEDTNLKRTANWLDVMYHSVTAMVGAGVLGLPAVFGHLGWAGGLIFLGFSLWVSWYTYKLLVYMHEVPDLDSKEQPGQTTGGIRRLDRYDQVADYVLGKPRGRRILLPFQIAVLMGMATTYTVVGGDSLHSFARHLDHEMSVPRWAFYIFFGGLQMLLSLLPSFNELSLVSLLGALMSVSYCTIAVAMSGTAAPAPGSVNYNPAAVERSDLARAMGVFNALTSILFAYGGHNVAVEIQATIPVNQKHPSTIPPMMKGVNVTFIITGLAYFAVAIMGFWAFGTNVADNVLLSFNGGPHSWVVAMADIMVVVHVASAYQVYTQPVFQLIEESIKARTGAPRVNPAIAAPIRVLYAALITVIGVVIPFFGSLMGFVGAIAITPTTFLLPPLLWLLYKRPARWSIDWTVNWFLVIVTSVVGVLGTVGSLYGIVTAWKTYKIFAV